MGLGATETRGRGQEPLEVVADSELISNAHAAVKLHCLLSDEPSSLPDNDLCR